MNLAFHPLDFSNPQHIRFAAQLAYENREDFTNDTDNDISELLKEYGHLLNQGFVHAYVCEKEKQFIGLVWIEIDRYSVGRLRGAMLPGYGYLFRRCLWMILNHAFNIGLRKIDVEFESYKTSLTAILQRFGFSVVGHPMGNYTKNGEPVETVLLELLKEDYALV